MRRTIVCAILIAICMHGCLATPNYKETIVSKIAFGSCNMHDKPQPVWDGIVAYKPDVWIWAGDVVYADTMVLPFYWIASPEKEIRSRYETQKERPEYKRLLEICDNVLGVWDDHDFGKNNGGKEFPGKRIVQDIFLDFLGEPKDSPRRRQEGIYSSWTYGPKDKRVKIILLDSRYFRDEPSYTNIEHIDMLGSAQWEWLEKEMKESDAKVNLIVSGIQVLPHDKPVEEKWANFPTSRDRLFRLIADSKAKGVVFLSGDVHYAEILGTNHTDNGYPLYEITSSGMTHTCYTQVPLQQCRRAFDMFMRSEYQVTDFYEFFNFGSVDIDWNSDPVTIDLNVRSANGTIVLRQHLTLKDLEYQEEFAKKHSRKDEEKLPAWMNWTVEMYRNLLLLILGILAVSIVLIRRCRPTATKTKSKKKTQ